MGIQLDGVNGTIKTGSSNVHNTGYNGQDGVFTGDLTVTGNIGVAGTLTYEDVTNIDSVGVITAREGIRVGAGKSIGSDGAAVVYYGDGSNLTGAGPTLANGSNDRLVTATGANALNGEANLTYDGNNISQAIDASGEGLNLTAAGNHYPEIEFNANRSGANNTLGYVNAKWNNTAVSSISFNAGSDTTNKDDGYITFNTRASGAAEAERFRIGDAGQIGLSGANYGSSGQVLTSGGASGAVSWATASGGVSSDGQDNTLGGTGAGDDFSGSNAIDNTLFGKDTGKGITTADYNTAVGKAALQGDGSTAVTGGENVAVGRSALRDTTSGNKNTAVGKNAGTNVEDAAECTLVGYQAGDSITSGNQNHAFGANALKSTTTGNYNIAMGFEALKTATTGGGNIAIGHKAMNGGNITGANNIAIGYEAGKSFPGNINGNVAIGYRALYQQNGDRYNTAVGYEAGMNIQGAHDIVAVGHKALKNLTSGAYNTAIGWQALESLQTGQRNTAVGRGCLDNCVSGNDNTCMGIDAGMNTTASGNVMIGTNAGRTNTTGADNVYIGTYVADQGTDGTRNVAIGMYAMSSGVSSYNSLVGWAAGHSISGGNYNTCLGYGAGYHISSGTRNTCIGHEAGYNQLSTDDNELWIARGATGPASTAVYIYGDGSGNVIRAGNGTSWSQTSDRRIKKNIVDNNIGLDIINKIRIRNFEYRTEDEIDRTEFGGSTDDKKYTAEEASEHPDINEGDYYKKFGIDKPGVQLGVIAQELEEVLPNMVSTNPKTSKKTTNTDELIWHLVNAVKELSAENTAMKARLDTLESS